MINDPFNFLKIEHTNNKREIRRAYSLLAKECHPDENPEAFEQLQEAYQHALQMADSYCEMDTIDVLHVLPNTISDSLSDKGKENNQDNMVHIALETMNDHLLNENSNPINKNINDKDSKGNNTFDDATEDIAEDTTKHTPDTNYLLAKMEEFENSRKPEDFNSPALNKLMSIYLDKKTRKNKKLWQEYFLSELFLNEQFSENFENGLACFLRNLDLEDNPNEVPAQFIAEISIAYALTYIDGGLTPNLEIYAPINPISYDPRYDLDYFEVDSIAVNALITFYQRQNEEWRDIRASSLFSKSEAIIRVSSFTDYIKAYRMAKSINNTSEKSYYDAFCCLSVHRIVEDLNKVNNDTKHINVYKDKCIILLFVHLINTKLIPAQAMLEVYKEMNLDTVEHSFAQKYHLPIKEAILNSYKELFVKTNDDVPTDDEIRSWIRNFSQIPISFVKGELYEDDPIWQNRVNELLEHKVWKAMHLQSSFIQSLLYKIYWDDAPLCMLETIKNVYLNCGISNNSIDDIIKTLDNNINYSLWKNNRFSGFTPTKEISIEELDNTEKANKILQALLEFTKLKQLNYKPSQEGIQFLNEINHIPQEIELTQLQDLEQEEQEQAQEQEKLAQPQTQTKAQEVDDNFILDIINNSELNDFSFSYIVLKGKVERRVIEVALFNECISDPMYDEYYLKHSDTLKQKLAKKSVTVTTVGFFIVSSKYHSPSPIAIGSDGKIYTLIDNIIPRGFDNFQQLLEKEVISAGLNKFSSIELYTEQLAFNNKHRQYYLVSTENK